MGLRNSASFKKKKKLMVAFFFSCFLLLFKWLPSLNLGGSSIVSLSFIPNNYEAMVFPVVVNCELLPPCPLPAFSSWHGVQCLWAVKSSCSVEWSLALTWLHWGHFPCFPAWRWGNRAEQIFMQVKFGPENLMEPYQTSSSSWTC